MYLMVFFLQQHLFSQTHLNRDWSFEDEVVKTKALIGGRRNMNYDPTKFERPEDVDDAYFPTMRRGRTLERHVDGQELLSQLNELPSLTAPTLSPAMWEASILVCEFLSTVLC